MLLLANSCDIWRDTTVGTNGRTAPAAKYTGVACLVLPMNHTTIIQNGFELGRAFDFYFDTATDVKTGDKLLYNGNSYIVKAVQPYFMPTVGHLHCLTEQEVA